MVYIQFRTRNFTYCHNPYDFAGYANADGFGTLPCCDEEEKQLIQQRDEDQLSSSASSSNISASDEELPKPRPVIVGPCGHTEVRRLRFKKGLSHYLCTTCGTKWRQGHNNS